jgi:hypothetical protein
LNYMHANPVIRGLVKHPRDWPWSSWGFTKEERRGWWRLTRKSERTRQPQATPRPRFQQRTWGTLRVVWSCEAGESFGAEE